MPERIIMALKLSSTVHGTGTGNRGRREASAAAWDSDVGTDHKMYQKSSHFCEHQEVCAEYISNFGYTLPGKSSFILMVLFITYRCSYVHAVHECAMCSRILKENL